LKGAEEAEKRKMAGKQLMEAARSLRAYWEVWSNVVKEVWGKDVAELPAEERKAFEGNVAVIEDYLTEATEMMKQCPFLEAFNLNCPVCNFDDEWCRFYAGCTAWHALRLAVLTARMMITKMRHVLAVSQLLEEGEKDG